MASRRSCQRKQALSLAASLQGCSFLSNNCYRREEKTKELVGHDAIMEIWAAIRSKADVKMEDMEPLHVFSFLLSPKDQKAAFALTHELLTKTRGGSTRSAVAAKGKGSKQSAASSSTRGHSKAAVAAKDEDAVVKPAASMFL